jgi:hypothetical protein
MRVRRRRRQNPELGDGDRQEHGQEAVSPLHNADLPSILYLVVKTRRRAAKTSHSASAGEWASLMGLLPAGGCCR